MHILYIFIGINVVSHSIIILRGYVNGYNKIKEEETGESIRRNVSLLFSQVILDRTLVGLTGLLLSSHN